MGRRRVGTLNAQVLGLRALDQLLAHLLERLDVARGERDADLVDLGAVAEVALVALVMCERWWLRQGR